MRAAALLALLPLLLAAAPAGDAGTPAELAIRVIDAPGVRVVVGFADPLPAGVDLAAAVRPPFEDAERLFDASREDSPVARVNRGGVVEGTQLPPDVCAAFRQALDDARRSDGLFDPTYGRADQLFRQAGHAGPIDDQLQLACQGPGWDAVVVRDIPFGVRTPPCSVRFDHSGPALALETWGRARALDQAVAALRAAGLRDFFLQAGPELYVAGHRAGRPWRIALPSQGQDAVAELSDRAVSFATPPPGAPHDPPVIEHRTCHAAENVAIAVVAEDARTAHVARVAAALARPKKVAGVVEATGGEAVAIQRGDEVVAWPDRGPVRIGKADALPEPELPVALDPASGAPSPLPGWPDASPHAR